MEACPMTTLKALALHSAAIIRDANVCRHWCRVIGSSFALLQAFKARLRTVVGMNGSLAVRPNTRSLPLRLVAVACARSSAARPGTIGTLRRDPFVLGDCAPSTSSHD